MSGSCPEGVGSSPTPATLPLLGNIKKKEGMFLIKISKEEAMELNKRFNVAYGENGISHTYTRYQHYYLCENKRNMNCLEKIRKEKISNGKY